MGNLKNRLQGAPFIRILFPFILGIILAEWLLPPKSPLWFIIPAILTLSLFLGKRSFKKEVYSGSLALIIFFFLGFSWAVYKRYDAKELPQNNYIAVLDEYPIEKGNSYRAVIRIIDSDTKLIAYFEKSDDIISASPGMLLFFKGHPRLIVNAGNPFEFDYQKYARHNNIGHRIYLQQHDYHFLTGDKLKNLRYSALILREKLLKRLNDAGIKGETFNVISAITLGARNNLDPETTRSFTRTGTLHVLAVSGGNVAVVYVFLYLFLGFLNKRRTVTVFTLLILAGIWVYTFITGLSPSVLRASVMFSFITVGQSMKRNPDMYNILAASAFVLLFIKPSLLFDVGFQLSYAAVFAIIFLQPILFKFYYSRYWIIDKFWMFFTVSVAAQIGTLPFSLWYFHQFPVYFWLSNIIVVPLVSLFLYITFFIILITPLLPAIGGFTSLILTLTGSMMLKFLHFVEYLPFAVIENIYPTLGELFFTITFITLATLYLIYRKSGYVCAALFSFTILLLLSTIDLWQIQLRNEIVIFNAKRKIVIAFTQGNQTTWVTNEKGNESETMDYLIKPYEGFRRIRKSEKLFLNFPGFQSNRMVSIKDNFINFNGLNIYLSQNKEGDFMKKDFPPTDLLFLRKHNSMQQVYYPEEIHSETIVIRMNSLDNNQNKAPLPEDFSSVKERALIIKIDQKNVNKRYLRIRNW